MPDFSFFLEQQHRGCWLLVADCQSSSHWGKQSRMPHSPVLSIEFPHAIYRWIMWNQWKSNIYKIIFNSLPPVSVENFRTKQ